MIHPPRRLITMYSDGSASENCWQGGEKCFYCGLVLSQEEYAVQWMGFGGDSGHTLYMHSGCTVELTIRLLRDVHEVECRTKIEPLKRWNGEREVG